MSTLSRASLPLTLLLLAACSRPAPETATTPPAAPAPSAPATAAGQGSGPAASAAAAPEEKCTNEPRTDENDKRPRCGGVGVASAPRAYRIVIGGGDPVDQIVCDISKTFVLEGKMFGTEFSGGMEGTYKMVRTPNIPGLQWKGSGTYRIDLPNGPDAPGKLNVHAREATTRAGGLVDENAGYTDAFTLTPVADCKAAPQAASG